MFPRIGITNAPAWFIVAEQNFIALGNYDTEMRFSVLRAHCRRRTLRHTEDVFLDAAMLPPGTDRFAYAKPIILQRCAAVQRVRLAPRNQRKATTWLLYLQCTMPDSNEGVIRDVFHAGLSWDVRRFLRLRCAGQPIWLLAHIAFCLEEETWLVDPMEAGLTYETFLSEVSLAPLYF